MNLNFLLSDKKFSCHIEEDMKPHHKSSPYKGFRIIGPQQQIMYARSLWEANYAHYLQYLQDKGEILYWLHEPQTFYFDGIKRGVTNYTPDFFVCTHQDGSGYWVEVKGFMDAKSNTKIKRFAKYFPEDELRVIDRKWFATYTKQYQHSIPNWESENTITIVPTEVVKQIRASENADLQKRLMERYEITRPVTMLSGKSRK